MLTRSEQSLERLRELVTILTASHASSTRGRAMSAWADFLRAAFLAEERRVEADLIGAQGARVLAFASLYRAVGGAPLSVEPEGDAQ